MKKGGEGRAGVNTNVADRVAELTGRAEAYG